MQLLLLPRLFRYYNTLAVATALSEARGKRVQVFLTAVGGGVFGNQTKWIAVRFGKIANHMKGRHHKT